MTEATPDKSQEEARAATRMPVEGGVDVPGPEAGAQGRALAEEGGEFSKENLERFDRLPADDRSFLGGLYEAAKERWQDAVGSRIELWTSKAWNGFWAGRYERQFETTGAARSEAAQVVERIGQEFEQAKADGILTPELEGKVGQERDTALARVTEQESRMEELKAARDTYEQKHRETVERIAGRWEDKIRANNEERASRAESLSLLVEDIAGREAELRETTAKIEKVRGRLAAGLVFSELRIAYGDRLAQLNEVTKILEEEIRDYQKEKQKEEAAVRELETKNSGLRKRIDGARGRPSRVRRERTRAPAGAAGTPAEAGAAARETAPETEEESEERPFGEYVNLWNSSHRRFSLPEASDSDELVDQSEAVAELRRQLLVRYPKQRKILSRQIEAFERSLET